jgi:hypothetical protein
MSLELGGYFTVSSAPVSALHIFAATANAFPDIGGARRRAWWGTCVVGGASPAPAFAKGIAVCDRRREEKKNNEVSFVNCRALYIHYHDGG